ncbi:RT0821/Lpp0805 family surface protein [Pandoraea pnomenusa]|uniref:RT0821/Lpp0805 family surface protein n=1 Tax=Pandoraea pnomenusa TaxID=93220 RepID=UPI00333E5D35
MSQIRLSRARSIAFGTALVIGASVAMPAFAASNLSFMDNSPLAFMRRADNASIAKAAGQVLSDKQDNETTEWTNKGTGNPTAITAQLTPTNTQKTDEQTCRDLIVVLGARGQQVTLRLPACKQGEKGHWELQRRAAP